MTESIMATEIAIANLVPYANHPFKLYQGRRSEALINSVRESGVLTPIIVRPQGENYEILSGHNRVEAAKTVGLTMIPAIVRDGLSEDEARLIVTVTNLIQRSFSDLTHSERAAALSEHYNAIKSQGRRTDILTSLSTLLGEDETCATVYHKLKARDVISKTYGISGTVVAQYLRVAQLVPSLQARLDNSEFALRAAVELSYLSHDTQEKLDKILAPDSHRIEVRMAAELREADEKAHGKLNKTQIERIISKSKSAETSSRPVRIEKTLLSQYFDEEKTDDEISDTIAKALDAWFANGNQA